MEIGSVPDGFVDHTRRRVEIDGVSTTEPVHCPIAIPDGGTANDVFVFFSLPPFGNDYVTGDTYCTNGNGLVVACEDPSE
jgi:hypothetical protein